jgi:hypothetical protein
MVDITVGAVEVAPAGNLQQNGIDVHSAGRAIDCVCCGFDYSFAAHRVARLALPQLGAESPDSQVRRPNPIPFHLGRSPMLGASDVP